MTTVSELFDAPAGVIDSNSAQAEGAGTRGRVRARVAATDSDGKVFAGVKSAGAAVASDLRHAWLWHGTPPTLADLWTRRIPDLEKVPGQNRVLWSAWLAHNHIALVLTAPAYMALWIVQHPAYLLLTALVTAPLIALWLAS